MKELLINTLVSIAISSLTPACKADNKPDHPAQETPADLGEVRATYCGLQRASYEARKYVNSSCDAAGFTSLFALACGQQYPVDLSVFSDSTGRLHRSPFHTECWNYELSDELNAAMGYKSGFSKDHLLMRMVGAWVQKDLAWVSQYIDYGETHSWEICHAATTVDYVGRCIASPQLVSLLRAMRERLTGAVALTSDSSDAIFAPADFEAHLRVWGIWLKGQVYGGITDAERGDLEALAGREDKNALYQAVWALYSGGDMTRVHELLADTSHWPRQSLPTNQENHCTDYLYQRDQLKDGVVNSDWLPCPNESLVIHPATEFGATLYVSSGGS